MKVYFFLLYALLIALSGIAQGYNTDSLKRLLNTEEEDTNRVMLLFYMSVELQRSNPDSAFALAQRGIRLAKQIDFPKGELLCKTSIARCFWSIGDYNSSIKLVLQDFKKIEEVNNVLLEASAIAALQDSYRDMGDYNEALKYALRNLKNAAEVEQGRHRKVQDAAIASIYLGKGDLDSATYYLQKTFSYPTSYFSDGWIYSIAGNLHIRLGHYDSASHFYRLSIAYLLLANNLKDLAGTYNSLASLFIKTGNYDSALYYAHKSVALAQEKNFTKEKLEASLLLSGVYESAKKDSAFYYYKLAMAAKDSVYNQEKQKQLLSFQFNEQLRQQEIRNTEAQYRARIKIYFLVGGIGISILIGLILWRNNREKQKAYEELKATQAQLIQSEKMASLGELTAGIAHEIQNPLNFVNNFSEVNAELITELKHELEQGNMGESKSLADDIEENSQKINRHGKRADAIVKNMLQHSRKNTGQKEPTDINALADEYLRLSYHGLRAKDKTFNAKTEGHFDESIGKVEVIPQDIGRVLLNLFNNAFYAVHEKKKKLGGGYEPTVSVTTKRLNDKIEIVVQDNGMGISKSLVDKIFQPFFTTKPTGQGTGLGLSLVYDIIKAHGGEIKVETKEGEHAQFIVILPIISI